MAQVGFGKNLASAIVESALSSSRRLCCARDPDSTSLHGQTVTRTSKPETIHSPTSTPINPVCTLVCQICRSGRTATPCGEDLPLVLPNPNPRTGEVKPPYRGERLSLQGATLIRSGKGSSSFNPAPRYGVDAPPYSSIRNFLHTRVQNFVRVKYMIIPYILCCSPVLTDLAHAYAKYVFQYVTGCVGGM